MKFLFPTILMLISLSPAAQDSLKTLRASRTSAQPRIDGFIDDPAWQLAETAVGFVQNTPVEGAPPYRETEVKILYDDYAIYIGALMYDSSPDSILRQLGNRDDEGLNADMFRFSLDPYNTRQDAYVFGVYASGVQSDSRYSDYTYDAVWQSAVKIHEKGWSVEMKIPYSALRFPRTREQLWALQFSRDIRRIREFSQWVLTPASQANAQKFWGTLTGISDIEPPLRLSLTPYLSAYLESAPELNADGTSLYTTSFSYNAGADIKYGIDERFTLDMTLLPDFGQVQSDSKVKNLSYREVNYDDYRPFFTEGTDLFAKNGLFYSRRIGKTPALFYDIPSLINPGETLIKNPQQAKLINALKVSGRTNRGLGIGFFNAVSGNTWAEIQGSSGTRKILTEPLTNFNVTVFDRQLKNSSSVFLINTSVIRNGRGYRDANVTSAGFNLQDKENIWEFSGDGALSQVFTGVDSADQFRNRSGYSYAAEFGKISGNWQFYVSHETTNGSYDRSDLGYQSIGNLAAYSSEISYHVFKPWKAFLRSNASVSVEYEINPVTGLPAQINCDLEVFLLEKDYWGIWFGGAFSPASAFDYYEPRTEGMYFRTAQWYYLFGGFSSDYRKKIAVDLRLNTGNFLPGNIHQFPLEQGYGFELEPRVRLNDRLLFSYTLNYNFDPLNPGFADFDSAGSPVFGGRELNTWINSVEARYIFKNDVSLSLNSRHYWNTGEYRFYYNLLDDGTLSGYPSYTGNSNFSYNSFYVDLVFSWQFAPGSILTIVYKNEIEKDANLIPVSFRKNFSDVMSAPQTNSISLKVLYYLDWQYFKNKEKVH